MIRLRERGELDVLERLRVHALDPGVSALVHRVEDPLLFVIDAEAPDIELDIGADGRELARLPLIDALELRELRCLDDDLAFARAVRCAIILPLALAEERRERLLGRVPL